MNPHIAEVDDILERIERLNHLIRLNKEQPTAPDKLAIEGFQRLRKQYITQLIRALNEFELEAQIIEKVA